MYLILFEKGENIKTTFPCTAYFKNNNNLDNRVLRLSMKILKQLQSLLSMMGVYQNLSPQQITKYEVYLHEHVHCITVTSLYSKNKVFIPPHKHSKTVIKK